MNKEAFKKSLVDQGYVLVDFYASWCGPCKTMDNVLDEVISQFDDLSLIKIDVQRKKTGNGLWGDELTSYHSLSSGQCALSIHWPDKS